MKGGEMSKSSLCAERTKGVILLGLGHLGSLFQLTIALALRESLRSKFCLVDVFLVG